MAIPMRKKFWKNLSRATVKLRATNMTSPTMARRTILNVMVSLKVNSGMFEPTK